MPATRNLRPEAARRLGPLFVATAAEDDRLEDLLDTMDVNGITAAGGAEQSERGIYTAATGSFMAGFVVAARLAEEDATSLHELYVMLKAGPLRSAVAIADVPAMTDRLRR